jgi:cytochrome b
VWDRFVRVFHWTLVGAFFGAYFTGEDVLKLHVPLGYLILILLAARIVWGFTGTPHARFSDFVCGSGTVLTDLKLTLLRKAPRFLGHSPAGGAMVVALLVFLMATSVSGLLVYAADRHEGPLAPWMTGVSDATEDMLEEAHEICANGTLTLVIIHVLGVVWTSLAHRENLVKSMFTGRKRAR